jgi:uncharacterized protein (TIGR00304 family)
MDAEADMVDLVTVGVVLLLVGFGIVMAAMFRSGSGDAKVKGGGVVLIGPIPLVFGSDAKWAAVAIVLAIVLVVLSLVSYWV